MENDATIKFRLPEKTKKLWLRKHKRKASERIRELIDNDLKSGK